MRLPFHRSSRADPVANTASFAQEADKHESTQSTSEPTLPSSPGDMRDETVSSPRTQQKSSVEKRDSKGSTELLASPRPDILCRALQVLRTLMSLPASRDVRIPEQKGLIRVLNDLGVCARLDVLISLSQLCADTSRAHDHVQIAQLLALDIVRHVFEVRV